MEIVKKGRLAMDGITLDILRNLCKDETILMTKHVYNRCRERGIRYSDIKNAILNGEIIEQYPDDFPYPSPEKWESDFKTRRGNN